MVLFSKGTVLTRQVWWFDESKFKYKFKWIQIAFSRWRQTREVAFFKTFLLSCLRLKLYFEAEYQREVKISLKMGGWGRTEPKIISIYGKGCVRVCVHSTCACHMSDNSVIRALLGWYGAGTCLSVWRFAHKQPHRETHSHAQSRLATVATSQTCHIFNILVGVVHSVGLDCVHSNLSHCRIDILAPLYE